MKKRIIATALVCLNIAFIWGNSLLNGETSGDISGGIMAWLSGIFGEAPWGELLLRKLGHFTEFACLGALLSWRFRLSGREWKPRFALPLLCGALVACADETIQAFVPGRGSSVIDVWVDIGGVCAGIILAALVHNLKNTRKTK